MLQYYPYKLHHSHIDMQIKNAIIKKFVAIQFL